MSNWRLLICGDREWDDQELIEAVILEIGVSKIEFVVEGGCRGADKLSRKVAEKHRILVKEQRADWNRYGEAAGPIRNGLMIKKYQPNYVLAFHDDIETSRGTKNMLEQAQKANIPVMLISHDGRKLSHPRSTFF